MLYQSVCYHHFQWMGYYYRGRRTLSFMKGTILVFTIVFKPLLILYFPEDYLILSISHQKKGCRVQRPKTKMRVIEDSVNLYIYDINIYCSPTGRELKPCLFDKMYFNFFVALRNEVVDSPISKECFLRDFLREWFKCYDTSSWTLVINKDGQSETV